MSVLHPSSSSQSSSSLISLPVNVMDASDDRLLCRIYRYSNSMAARKSEVIECLFSSMKCEPLTASVNYNAKELYDYCSESLDAAIIDNDRSLVLIAVTTDKEIEKSIAQSIHKNNKTNKAIFQTHLTLPHSTQPNRLNNNNDIGDNTSINDTNNNNAFPPVLSSSDVIVGVLVALDVFDYLHQLKNKLTKLTNTVIEKIIDGKCNQWLEQPIQKKPINNNNDNNDDNNNNKKKNDDEDDTKADESVASCMMKDFFHYHFLSDLFQLDGDVYRLPSTPSVGFIHDLLGVDDRLYRLGIGLELIQTVDRLAMALGYRESYAIATSAITQRMSIKRGNEIIRQLNYHQWYIVHQQTPIHPLMFKKIAELSCHLHRLRLS